MGNSFIVEKVIKSLQRFCAPESKVIAAVSGGADSMALADACLYLREKGYFSFCVLHVEHGLRQEEGLRDAALVESFCKQHKIDFYLEHLAVNKYAKENKLSIENAARDLRYAALDKLAKKVNADYIITAHHLDDQAETVLLKLLRGTSASGLSAMSVYNGKILRPFLDLTKAELEAYCHERRISYCHDSSNDDTYYTRNKIRQVLLPYLEKEFNPEIKQNLAQMASLLQKDEQFINDFVEREYALRSKVCENMLELETFLWQDIPLAVRTRLLRKCYFAAGGKELGFVHTKAVDELCIAQKSGRCLNLPQKIQAVYAYDKLCFTKNKISKEADALAISFIPEDNLKLRVPNGEICVKIVLGNRPMLNGKNIVYPAELVQGKKLILRRRCNGDRFFPYAGSGSKKLKDYLIDKKIPRYERDKLLLLCSESKILGVFGLANGAWPYGEYKIWFNFEFIERIDQNEQ